MNYLYDGSYEGFLTCVYRHYYGERADGICPADSYRQLDMLRYAETIETDELLAGRVLDAITNKLSKWDAERVYRVFCTNEPEKEMKLLRYLWLGFKRGPKIRLLHGNQTVKDVEAAEQRLGKEVHRLVGLIRFSELEGGVLYAPVTPDNDVLEFLAPHFADRFRYDPFVIHDKSRGKALFAFNKQWRIEAFDGELLPPNRGDPYCDNRDDTRYDNSSGPHYSNQSDPDSDNCTDLHYDSRNDPLCDSRGGQPYDGRDVYSGDETPVPPLRVSVNEESCRRLWKLYFDAMATKERLNPKLQRQYVPVRYREHLPEFDR